MLDKVLQISKSVDDEKVGVSFQMPKTLKKEIDNLCTKNGIKLTTFFNALAQTAIEEMNGKGDLQKIEGQRLADERVKHLNALIDGHGLDIENAIDVITERNRLIELFDLGGIYK